MDGFRVLIVTSALVTAALPVTAVAGSPSPFADAPAVGDARLAAERGRGTNGGVVVITGNTIINDGLRADSDEAGGRPPSRARSTAATASSRRCRTWAIR